MSISSAVLLAELLEWLVQLALVCSRVAFEKVSIIQGAVAVLQMNLMFQRAKSLGMHCRCVIVSLLNLALRIEIRLVIESTTFSANTVGCIISTVVRWHF